MDGLTDILCIALEVLGLWTLASVLAAIPVAALFRAQARRDVLVRQAERRRTWLESAC
jgi:hypothetical protein